MRLITLVRNAPSAARFFTLWSGFETDFGADTRVVDTSSGDQTGTADDAWIALFNNARRTAAPRRCGTERRALPPARRRLFWSAPPLPSQPVVHGVDFFQRAGTSSSRPARPRP